MRQDPQWLPRNTATADEKSRAKRLAAVLELTEPFTLAAADGNYAALIKTNHPDVRQGVSESTARAAELNEAIEYFREKLKA